MATKTTRSRDEAEQLYKKIHKAVAAGAKVKDACNDFGTHKSNYYAWRAKQRPAKVIEHTPPAATPRKVVQKKLTGKIFLAFGDKEEVIAFYREVSK